MPRIAVLPDDVIDQIAAGEVVERPASAVKELVENSIDAEATHIEVDITGGGRVLIRVSDNGFGIAADDLPAAVLRHATSKLTSVDDLFRISSLGFRGEALPSIASVSRFTLSSRTRQSQVGYGISLAGGAAEAVREVAMPVGSIVEVRDLFYNTPARLKFLKSQTAESQRIVSTMERMILSRPDLRFVLKVDGRIALESPGNGRLLDAAATVFGAKAARQLRPVQAVEGQGFRLSGMLGLPELSRNNRTWQYFFLNGRYVEHRGLSFALEEAYRSLMPVRRYPVAVLNILVPPDTVDVNVSPTKVEVRFQDERSVVSSLIRHLRAEVERLFTLSADTPAEGAFADHAVVSSEPAGHEEKASSFSALRHDLDFFSTRSLPLPSQQVRETLHYESPLKTYRLIGQVLNSYILVERDDGLHIIDQHAAHERILYEQFRKVKERRVQQLAMPVSLDFGSLAQLVPCYLESFAEAGFEMEHFGGSTYLLRSMPDTFRGDFSESTLLDMMQELAGDQMQNQQEKVAVALSCRAAIKAGTRLTSAEMIDLLDKLYETDLSVTCPHGRPVVLSFDNDRLFRLFHPR
jgi:DNA mismatch repair protein MutL